MHRRFAIGFLGVIFLFSGCMWEEVRVAWHDTFGTPDEIDPTKKLPPASMQVAMRVDQLGGEVLAANKEISFRPTIWTIGKPGISVFHRGTREIYLTEGLATRCKTDGELAAVICNELARMTVEAEAQGRREGYDADRPYTPRVTNAIGDSRSDPDMTGLASQAYWEKENRNRRSPTGNSTRDPSVLAREYLQKAGFNPDELQKVQPLLRQAEANPEFEKQFRLIPMYNDVGTPPPLNQKITEERAANKPTVGNATPAKASEQPLGATLAAPNFPR